jgi:hypothetical protein
MLRRERAAYKESRRNRAEIHELRTQIQDQGGTVVTHSTPPTDVSISQRTQVSQLSTGNSIMGGRNEQANNRNLRRAGAVITTRHVKASTPANKSWNDPPERTMATNECDTNADSCCLGKNFHVLHSTFQTADVYAYDTLIKPIEHVPIVTGATAYDDPVTTTTYILVFHESLY